MSEGKELLEAVAYLAAELYRVRTSLKAAETERDYWYKRCKGLEAEPDVRGVS